MWIVWKRYFIYWPEKQNVASNVKQLFIFIQKEFKHVFRDRKTLLMLFGMPTTQIILFGFALTNEIKNSEVAVLDAAKTELSQSIIQTIDASTYFDVRYHIQNTKQAETLFQKGKIKAVVVIPVEFKEAAFAQQPNDIQLITDASDPNVSTTIRNYLTTILNSFFAEKNKQAASMQIVPEVRMLYNPELKGAFNFVPGVISLVLMLVCTMMSSVSIVREKEMGTMEILLVSPFKPLYIIISKLAPYFLISIFNLVFILVLSVTLLGLSIKGSVLLLVLASALFIITSLAIGLLISTTAKSQQNAMMISLLGMMLPTMLLTGFMFPIENMPLGLQMLSNIVPSRWFFIIIKNVMLKGLGFMHVWKEMGILTLMAFLLLVVSIRKFKIRLQE